MSHRKLSVSQIRKWQKQGQGWIWGDSEHHQHRPKVHQRKKKKIEESKVTDISVLCLVWQTGHHQCRSTATLMSETNIFHKNKDPRCGNVDSCTDNSATLKHHARLITFPYVDTGIARSRGKAMSRVYRKLPRSSTDSSPPFKAGVSNTWPMGQNRPSKGFNPPWEEFMKICKC